MIFDKRSVILKALNLENPYVESCFVLKLQQQASQYCVLKTTLDHFVILILLMNHLSTFMNLTIQEWGILNIPLLKAFFVLQVTKVLLKRNKVVDHLKQSKMR